MLSASYFELQKYNHNIFILSTLYTPFPFQIQYFYYAYFFKIRASLQQSTY